MRTEQLTKCCEPLQKMRVRSGPCKKLQVCNDQEKAQSEKDWEKSCSFGLRYVSWNKVPDC